jgi:hypothetical protein
MFARRTAIAGAASVALAFVPGAALARDSGPGPGNSPNAKFCHHGGWRHLTTETGQPFRNGGQCTSYAARGGQLRFG